MTRHDDARLAEVLADADTKAVFRRLLQQALDDLIESELATAIGPSGTSAPTPGRTNATAACAKTPVGRRLRR